MKSVELNVNFLYPLEKSENHRFLMFSGGGQKARAAKCDVVSLKRY